MWVWISFTVLIAVWLVVIILPMPGQLGIFNVNIDKGPVLLPERTLVGNMRDTVLVAAAKAADRFVYIGRPKAGGFWGFGNPFASRPGTQAAKVVHDPITAYENWLDGKAHQEVLPDVRGWQLAHLPELKGKVLLCWCKGIGATGTAVDWGLEDCHGDILKRRADGLAK